jgi:hypothetical protein
VSGSCLRLILRPRRVLGHRGDQFTEFQFQLIQELAAALGGGAELVMPQFSDDQLEVRDHRLRANCPGLRAGGTDLGGDARLPLGRQCRAQGLDVIRVSRSGHHAESESETVALRQHNPPRGDQPAASGL